jgi:hypothetical protein
VACYLLGRIVMPQPVDDHLPCYVYTTLVLFCGRVLQVAAVALVIKPLDRAITKLRLAAPVPLGA